jgi:hypothetical protein
MLKLNIQSMLAFELYNIQYIMCYIMYTLWSYTYSYEFIFIYILIILNLIAAFSSSVIDK